jgi:hypothetical protein
VRVAFLAVPAILVALAGCGGTRTVVETVTVPATSKAGLGPPGEQVQFGHIRSLARKDGRYELSFDPEWFLTGETANAAAAEDGAVPPGEPVPNDNYRVDEGHRLFTYRVRPNARVTVLTTKGDPAQLGATPVSVAELARIVDGTSDVRLFEPLDSGVWITVDGDTVREIDQQYRP